MDKSKICNKCFQDLPLSMFYRESKNKDGRKYTCKVCQNRIKKAYRANNPEKVAEENRKRRESRGPTRWERVARLYGLSEEGYYDLLQSQGNCCAICKTVHKKYHIDHCHNSGKVRGILCSKCNTGLGKFNDSPDMLLLAVKYLKERSDDG